MAGNCREPNWEEETRAQMRRGTSQGPLVVGGEVYASRVDSYPQEGGSTIHVFYDSSGKVTSYGESFDDRGGYVSPEHAAEVRGAVRGK